MKFKPLIYLSLFPLLTSCSSGVIFEDKAFAFDTMIDMKLYEGEASSLKEIKNLANTYSKLTDNYLASDVNNVYTINNTNEDVSVDSNLYKLLKLSYELKDKGLTYFNPLCGSLAKKWKEALDKKEVLSSGLIEEELAKINSSSLTFKDNNIVQRVGDAEIDLGAIAKGYYLDSVKDYFVSKNYTKYLINAGTSSILLGSKNTEDGLFNIGLSYVKNGYLKLKDCFVSTSSNKSQGVMIDGKMYSHIVNLITGSAINENDVAIVVSNNGTYGDAISTTLTMCSIEEVKEIESLFEVKAIIIRGSDIIYKNQELEVYYH